jgi:hypothetical protein
VSHPPRIAPGSDLDDVEAARSLRPSAPGEKDSGHAGEPAPLRCRDRFGGAAERVVGSRLDLDEDHDGPVPRYEIDLTATRAKAASDDFEPSPLQPLFGGGLTGASEQPTWVGARRRFVGWALSGHPLESCTDLGGPLKVESAGRVSDA